METKKSKRLETFEAALQTGKIGISKPTASVLVELSKINEAVDRIIQIFCDEDKAGSDKICERYGLLTDPLINRIMKDWTNLVFQNISYTDCTEL